MLTVKRKFCSVPNRIGGVTLETKENLIKELKENYPSLRKNICVEMVQKVKRRKPDLIHVDSRLIYSF